MPPELAFGLAETAARRAVSRAGDTPLTTRSLDPVALGVAAVLVLYPAYLAAVQYLAWLDLWVADAWLVPLLFVMAVDVTAGALLAGKLGRFRLSALAWGHAKKLVELMIVAIAFTIQAAQGDGLAWGTYATFAVIGYELNSVRRIAGHFGVRSAVLDALIGLMASKTEPITKQLHHERIARTAVAEKVDQLADSGVLRISPERAKKTLHPEDVRPAGKKTEWPKGDTVHDFDSFE